MKGRISRIPFIMLFFLVLCYPAYGYLFDDLFTLSGVTAESTLEKPTADSIMDGSFQSSLNTWFENHFPGRSMLIKFRSQLRYSIFNESPNVNVAIGKDKYLFEYGYIDCEFGISVSKEEQIDETIAKLELLQDLLISEGKELYLFITPSKAYFCKDKVPGYYHALAQDGKNNYQMFTEKLSGSTLHYFDSHAYIEQYDSNDLKAPIFYPTGIHWSHSWGNSAAKAFSEYITENGKWSLSSLELSESESDTPAWPDADLYQSINIITPPRNIQYYTCALTIKEEKDHPNVFYRGGSFMGQSLNSLISAGVFGKDFHFENGYYFTDRYTQSGNASSYEEIDDVLHTSISETDILILEVNEAAIGDLSFGFLDYLLEHPDYLKYPER